MEYFRYIEKRIGVDIGYNDRNLHPKNREGCVGKSGLDKTLKLQELLEIAYKMENPRPNIIIKAGKNAKWYLKYCDYSKIDLEIEKTKWRDTSRATMFIITWDD
tara:strand:+ start:267 stop:578 length:312 start_codon:yes stop_codon:yes gene_type:complete